MGSEVNRYTGGGGLVPRDARRGSRIMSHDTGTIRQNRADVETDVTLAKTASITAVTGAMMGEVARIAQLQTQLELMAPQAAARLNMMADNHALDLVEQSAEHRRALRRF